MPISILTFHVPFVFTVLVGLYIYLTFYNKRTQKEIANFISQANELRPTVFQNIKIRYWETSGLRTSIYPNNHCDLYLFDDYIAIVRRQDFIFKVFFAPILLTSDIATTTNKFNYLQVYKPDRIMFKTIVKGEIEIKIVHPKHKHYVIEITLKGLNNEQVTQLEKIKNWC